MGEVGNAMEPPSLRYLVKGVHAIFILATEAAGFVDGAWVSFEVRVRETWP